MRSTRITALLTAVAALATMLAIPALSGANHIKPSKIRVAESRPFLHGVIQSKREPCERQRFVVVRKVRPGRNKVIGWDNSSYRGAWSVDVNRTGTYTVGMRRELSSDGYYCSKSKIRVTIG